MTTKTRTILGSLLFAALAAGTASAGVQWPVFPTGNVVINQDARYAYGWMSSARNSPNSSERISCFVLGVTNTPSFAACTFNDSDGNMAGCYTDDPNIISAIQYVQSDVYVTASWEKDGSCNNVTVYTDSANAPKAP